MSLDLLFNENVVRNSTVIADLYSNGLNGVDSKKFEEMHHNLSSSGFFKCSDWQQKVFYTTNSHPCDTDQGKVTIHYSGNDACDVSCTRTSQLTPLYLETTKQDWNYHVYREKFTTAQPPISSERYSKVLVRMERTLTRKSSSVKGLDWNYVFAVEWSSRSVCEAYAATPTYKLSLQVDTRPLHTELKDNLVNIDPTIIPDYTEQRAAAVSLNAYLASTMLLKLQELVCANLTPCKPRVQTKIIYRDDKDGEVPGINQDDDLIEEGNDDADDCMFDDDGDGGDHNGDYE